MTRDRTQARRPTTAHHGWLVGQVQLGTALAGARITLFDAQHRALAVHPRATHASGAFVLPAPAQGRARFVVASGGTLRGRRFVGHLVARLPADGTPCTINAVTTLVEACRARHPGWAAPAAKRRVQRLLQWPAGRSLDALLEHDGHERSLFDPGALLERAQRSGGFDRFVQRLVDDIDAGRTQAFKTMWLRGGDFGDIASFIGKGVGGGMAGWVGGQAIGWVFHALGYRSTQERDAEKVQEKLDAMAGRLDDIHDRIGRVEDLQQRTLLQIDDLSKSLQKVYQGLAWAVQAGSLQAEATAGTAALVEPLSYIKSMFGRLCTYARFDLQRLPPGFDTELQELMRDIVAVRGIEQHLEALDMHLRGATGQRGLLHIWAEMIALTPEGQDPSDLYRAYRQRLAQLLAWQLAGAAVMVDACHGLHGADDPLARDFWQRAKQRVLDQLALYLASVEKAYAARVDGPLGLGFNPYVGQPQPATLFQFLGSPLLAEADRWVGSIRDSLDPPPPGHGTVLVRVLNYPKAHRLWADSPTVTLRAEAGDGADIDAASQESVTLPAGRAQEPYPVVSVPPGWEGEDIAGATVVQLWRWRFTVPHGRYRIAGSATAWPDEQVTLAVDEGLAVASHTILGSRRWLKTEQRIALDETRPLGGVAVDSTHHAFLLQGGNLIKTDPQGQLVWVEGRWGASGAEPPQGLYSARAAAVGPRDEIFVLDTDAFHSRVRKYGSSGQLLGEWGRHGQGPGEFVGPVALAVDSLGYVVVADRSLFRVQRFGPDGKRVTGWGTQGTAPGQFGHIAGVAIDAVGHVYVSDFIPGNTGFGRIQKFTAGGDLVRAWPLPGEHAGLCGQPSGLAVDRERGRLYVADTRQLCLHVFDLDGQPLVRHAIGEAFSKADAWTEVGLAVDSAGSLYMTDLKRRQVLVWRCLRLVQPAWPSA